MELDEPFGDDEPRPPLLPPDDRLWRHPSEVATHGPPALRPRPARTAPRLWAVATLAALTSSLFTVAVVAATGGFSDSVSTSRSVESVALPVTTLAAGATVRSPAGADDKASHLAPTIVQLEMHAGGSSPWRGAGVVFRQDGHVLTSRHLLDNALGITVVTATGERRPGRLVGADPQSDVAVVKIEGADAAPAPLGSAAALEVGHEVMTVGPIASGSGSNSTGAVIGLGRQLARHGGPPLLDMIEIDAIVGPGLSGGALVDARGAVVGVITAVAGRTGRGYATPIDLARAVGEQLIEGGSVVGVWLGIEGDDAGGTTADGTTADGTGPPRGALVKRVRPGSPAAEAGISPGDVITAVDQVSVLSMAGLRLLLRPHRPGDVVVLAMNRGSLAWSSRVELRPRPASP